MEEPKSIEQRLQDMRAVLEESPLPVVKTLEALSVLTPDVLADAFAVLEDDGAIVGLVCLNPRDYADLRMFGRDVLDLEVRVPLLRKGIMGRLWGAVLWVGQEKPLGSVWVVADNPRSAVVIEVSR